jgi:hypothetical protein
MVKLGKCKAFKLAVFLNLVCNRTPSTTEVNSKVTFFIHFINGDTSDPQTSKNITMLAALKKKNLPV